MPELIWAVLNCMKLILKFNTVQDSSQFKTQLMSLFHSPSSGPMMSWKSSGQLTTTTSPTLAACQQVRLSHIHGHPEGAEDKRNSNTFGQCEALI